MKRAEDWPWSSVPAHLAGKDDGLVTVAPLLERYGDLAALVDAAREADEAGWQRLRKAESTGRPVGGEHWIAELERRSGRRLAPAKRGPKRGKRYEFSKLSP